MRQYMIFPGIDPVILILGGAFIILVILIIIGTYRHVHKTAFKPSFVTLSDGSVQMECYNFGGLQTARTKRYYDKYKVGMLIKYGDKLYKIVEFKEVADPSLLRPDMKIVAYLEEVIL